jgi:excisionase family DNA binding protein
MTPGQVAAIFGVKPRAVRSWADSRKLTVIRTLGGHRRYKAEEIRAIAAQRTADAEAVA